MFRIRIRHHWMNHPWVLTLAFFFWTGCVFNRCEVLNLTLIYHDLHRALTHLFSGVDVNKALLGPGFRAWMALCLCSPWNLVTFSETDDAAGIQTLPAEYLSFIDQFYSTVTASAPQSTSRKVAGRDLELLFSSFAIKVKPDKYVSDDQEVLWTRATDKWLQVFEVLWFSWAVGSCIG